VTERVALPAALAVLCMPIILYGIGSYSLVNGDEGIYHYMARHMVESGNWFRLEFTGEQRVYDTLTHAPLYLWAKAVVILVFGDSYLSMRLLSASLGVVSVLATYRLVDHLANPRAAFIAGLVQSTTFAFVYLHAARTGEMETAIALAFTLAVISFLRALDSGKGFGAHHLCLIALMNLKLALVAIPILAEAAYFAIQPAARARLRDWVKTACWMIPLGLAWHGYQLFVHFDELGSVTRELLGQSWGATPGRAGGIGPVGRAGYYARELVFSAYPHVLFYPWALGSVLAGARHDDDRRGWTLVALFIASVCLFFLSITIHQPWYLLPAIPLAAAFMGAALERLTRERPGPVALGSIAVAAAVAMSVRLPLIDFDPFVERAAVATPPLAWSGFPALGVMLLVALAAAAVVAHFRALRPVTIAAPLIVGLLAVGGIRVVAPLRFVHHESEMERLHSQLESARLAGKRIGYPVVVRENGMLKARYFFADEFDVHRLSRERRARGEYFELREKRGGR